LQSQSAKASAPSRKGSQGSKAAAVETQCRMWNHALAVRITLQRCLVAADRLPRGAAYSCMLQDVPEAPQAVKAARQTAIQAIEECMHTMHYHLLRVAPGKDATSPPAVPSSQHDAEVSANSGGSFCAELWSELEKLESRFSSFRDCETDRWHRKTLLATGQTALKSVGGLQALNKPLSQQVHDVLRAPEKALQKVRRQRTEHSRVLCEAMPCGERRAPGFRTGGDSADTHVDAPGDDGAGCGLEFNTSVVGPPPLGSEVDRRVAGQEWEVRRAAVAQAAADIAHDPESFDDSAFYQVLLQEFLESEQAKRLMVDTLKARFCLSC
jgi:protein AATF/BFR2